MKKGIDKQKILIACIACLSMMMCISVGFATWIVTSSAVASLNGNIDADDYASVSLGDAYCISDLTIDGFRSSEHYGFVDETSGTYSTSINISGLFSFEVIEAKTAINSLKLNKQFSLKFEFTASVTTDFTFGSMSLNGFSNSSSHYIQNNATATSAFNIVLSDEEYSQIKISNISIIIPLSFNDTLSSFPDLSNATYALSIIPGEVLL